MRRALLLAALVSLSLAACSSSAKSGSPTTTSSAAATTTTTTAAAASTAPTTGVYVSTVPDGKHSAYIDSVDLSGQTITIDPMQYLTGQAAVTAFKHDNPTAVEGPPNDYYIVNPTEGPRVAAACGDGDRRARDREQRSAHDAGCGAAGEARDLLRSSPRAPFWVTTKNGTVTDVMEQFVP